MDTEKRQFLDELHEGWDCYSRELQKCDCGKVIEENDSCGSICSCGQRWWWNFSEIRYEKKMSTKVEQKTEHEKADTGSFTLSDLLCPKRYAAVNFNVLEHENGTLLKRQDVIAAINACFSDSDRTITLLHEFLDNISTGE